MPSHLASRPRILMLAAAVAALGLGAYLYDDGIEYRTCEEKLEIMEMLEPNHVFMAVLTDRVQRWLVEHPNTCPRAEDIATFAELAEKNWRSVKFTCNSNRLYAIEMEPLVHFYPRRLAGQF